MTYLANGGSRPHAIWTMDGSPGWGYDANGNVTTDGQRTWTWNYDNTPSSINGPGSANESYGYDADGERVTVTSGSNPTTVFLGGLWVEVVGSSQRGLFLFNGQLMVSGSAGLGLTYYHSDHLGSIVTAGSGTSVGTQDYTPWGEERNAGGMPQTAFNYTGQRKDTTGLLDYHARQYDPALARFTSADSIVPGAASASGGGAATLGGGSTTPLTVDFHEPGFANQLNQHNAATGSMGFWFQLSSEEQQKAESPMGPANPQALNRYSYVLNNPLRYTDPTGHFIWWAVGAIIGGVGALGYYLYTHWGHVNFWEAVVYTAGGAAAGAGLTWLVEGGIAVLSGLLGEAVDQAVERLPVPDIPASVSTVAEFGSKVMQWGTGSDVARARMATLSSEELESNGVTLDMAKAWRDFYLNEIVRNPSNPSAPGRAELMQRAVELLSNQQ
ncbi:MAG: hypothetical protein H0X37_11920 [Herpetosiphonaceae bacterium]|nr:hypothetical protein [Herpetosiphonaceae bacterium]